MSANGGVFSFNQFLFSACSIKGFKAHLLDQNLNASKDAHCLLNFPKQKTIVDELGSKLPGEIWSSDEQCRHLYGMNYSFSREKINKSNILCFY